MNMAAPVKGQVMPERVVRMDEGFRDRLKNAMARRGVTPSQLASGVGVVPQTVSRWRRGECPEELRLQQIASYLRINPEWLRLGLGDPDPRVQARGDMGAPRTGAGRRREDIELRATAIRKDAARLDVLVRLIQAYRDAGRPASPDILAEWLEIAAGNGEETNPPPVGPA